MKRLLDFIMQRRQEETSTRVEEATKVFALGSQWKTARLGR